MARERLSGFFWGLQLFGIGLSWGGYKSLVLPVDTPQRTVRPFAIEGQLVRVQAGLEDVDDLIRDFTAALDRAARA